MTNNLTVKVKTPRKYAPPHYKYTDDDLLSDRSGNNSKHVFLGDTRIATKVVSASGSTAAAETVRQYYYHSDHLGSAQLITDYRGEEYERLEYTPYGELWIEKAAAVSVLDIPYRFTGKERDEETGLYYYGARYLDPKTSRWLSGDPALGEYVPSAPVNDEAKKRNGSLPGQGGVFNYVNLHVYHYAGNNPVKYVDPDGRLMRDENGDLIFQPEGEPVISSHASGKKALMQEGYLFADDGTQIEAGKSIDKNERGFDTNCHGYTFGDSQYWINPDEVSKIIEGDKYVNPRDPKVGDIVVYYEGRGNAIHSAKIVDVRKKYNILGFKFGRDVIEVEAISGVTTEIKRTRVENGWPSATHYVYYRGNNK
jgi:RHS repeat-associated protein